MLKMILFLFLHVHTETRYGKILRPILWLL